MAKWFVVALWVLLAVTGREARADVEVLRQSLKDLKGVHLVVEKTSLDAERHGLAQAALATDVELWLRQNGIPVLSEAEWKRVPGRPYLYLSLSTVNARGTYAYVIRLELNQLVTLERHPALFALGSTWSARTRFGAIGASAFAARLREGRGGGVHRRLPGRQRQAVAAGLRGPGPRSKRLGRARGDPDREAAAPAEPALEPRRSRRMSFFSGRL